MAPTASPTATRPLTQPPTAAATNGVIPTALPFPTLPPPAPPDTVVQPRLSAPVQEMTAVLPEAQTNRSTDASAPQAAATNSVELASSLPLQAKNRQPVTSPLLDQSLLFSVPSNDLFANALLFTSMPYTRSQSNILEATTSVGDPAFCSSVKQTVWYRYMPTSSQVLTVSTAGSSYDTVLAIFAYDGTRLDCNDDYSGSITSQLSLYVAAGFNYYIGVGAYGSGVTVPSTLTINASVTAMTAPSNDLLWNARDIGTPPITNAQYDTAGATTTAGDPAFCTTVTHTVWYSYTPPVAQTLTLDTLGSTYDTVLAVFNGGGLSLACNDNASGYTSRVSLAVAAGYTYSIGVGSRSGSALPPSTLMLYAQAAALAPPANDLIGSATVISAMPYTRTQNDVMSATTTPGEPALCAYVSRTVWYRYTAPSARTITFSTLGSSYDTVLGVFDYATLASLGCNDDYGGAVTSELTVYMAAGASYYIAVGAFGMSYYSPMSLTLTASSFACPAFPYTVPAGNTTALIGAIECANHNGAGTNNVINLTNGAYTLVAVNNTTTGPNGLPVIASAASAGTLTIHGNGATITRSAAVTTPQFRFFEITPGGNLALDNLTLSSGNTLSNGGAIFNNGGTLMLTSSTLSGNSAAGSMGGGAIYSVNGTLTLTSSTFSGNSAPAGGPGGGIHNSGGTLSVTNSSFSNNSAPSYEGGAIYNSGGLTVSGGSFTSNSAAEGGGIYTVGEATVSAATFTSNVATQFSGGGIISWGTLTVNSSNFSTNLAFTTGGAIYGGVDVTVADSTFTSNTANTFGGAIYHRYDTLTVTGGSFTGNFAVSGGGIYCDAGVLTATLSVTGSTFSNNHAYNSSGGIGGAIVSNECGATLTNATFSDNEAVYLGGAIINFFGTMTVTNSTFSSNFTNYSEGGAIFNSDGSMLRVINSTFSGNVGANGAGAIWNGVEATLIVSNSTFSGNSTPVNGGAINNYSGTMTLVNDTFSGNSAADGGGIYNSGGSPPLLPSATMNLYNLIIANSPSGGDCANHGNATIGLSLIEDSSCAAGFVLGVDPNLGALTGSPAYFPLNAGSAAINEGANVFLTEVYVNADLNGDGDLLDTLTTDQGGGPRISGGTVDFGADESGFTGLVVDTTSDADLRACTSAANDCSLRGAINFANTLMGTDDITFSASVFNTAKTITLASNQALITESLNINGPALGVTISGANSYRPFQVASASSVVSLKALTIVNGLGISGGGGIASDGTLILNGVTVANNAAVYGAGISSTGALYIINSTISGNNSTGTSPSDGGGALDKFGSTATTIINSTIVNNTAANAARSGLWLENGTLTIQNSIVANNNGANNCSVTGGTLIDGGYNLDNGTSCGFSGAVGQNTNPLLGALANNGGSAKTIALLAGSPAINRGDNGKAVDHAANPLTTDERGSGYPRIIGSRVDIGAFESSVVNVTPTISDISDRSISFNSSTGAITFTVGDNETAPASLTLTKVSSNTALVPLANIVFGGSGANRTVTVTPAANQSGTATLTITVSDGALSASDSFVLTVLGDALFSDGFESGDLSAWSASSTDGGDLSVAAGAALSGSYGLQFILDDINSLYVTDNSPSAEPRYRARFLFDPNGLVMATNNNFGLFYGYQGTSTAVLQLQLAYFGGSYQLRVGALNDADVWLFSGFVPLSDAPHLLEVDWQAASGVGANNGALSWWVDEVPQTTLSGLDSDTRRVDWTRLAALGVDAGTSGSFFLDGFVSRRLTYIGAALAAPTLVSPANAAVVMRETPVSLSWNAVSGASQYYAEFSNGSTVNLTSGWISGTSWAPGVQPGGSYSWRVKARDGSGEESPWSASRTLTVRPAAPTNLQGNALSPTQVNLTWTASVDAPAGISGYSIYREGVLQGTASASATTFIDSSAVACAVNHYALRAYKSSVNSVLSSSLTVTTPCDAVFSDGFESGSLSAWSASGTDGGDLSVTAGAALSGSYGLQFVLNDINSLYVTDNSPSAEPRYRARFLFDPNGLAMATNNNFGLFYGYQGTSTAVLQQQLAYFGGSYQLRVGALNDAGVWLFSGFVPLSDAPHLLEVDWQAASGVGANNGALAWWVDEVAQPALNNLDTDTRRIDWARLAALGVDAGTSGSFFLDGFVSRRLTYIGADVGGLSAFGLERLAVTDEPAIEVTKVPEEIVVATVEATLELTALPTEVVSPAASAEAPAAATEATSEPVAEVTAAVTELPTEAAAPTQLPTYLPTALPFPTLPPPATSVVTAEPTLTPTPPATVTPFSLPLYQTMDDGAPLWSATGGWQLSADGAFGGSGLGWRAAATGQLETLMLRVPIALGMAQHPQLSFTTRLASASLPEVQLSLDSLNWQTVAAVPPSNDWTTVTIDLTAYAGQTVYLQWLWLSPSTVEGPAAESWQVDNLTVQDVLPTAAPTDIPVTPTAAATDALPTAASTEAVVTPSPTDAPTEGLPAATVMPTEVPTEAVLPTTIVQPTAIPTDLPSPTGIAINGPAGIPTPDGTAETNG